MNIPVQNCSSCAACANVCARSAISMQLDKEGFYRPYIDESKCVQCGACEKVCPWSKNVVNPNNAVEKPKTVAAYAKEESTRLQSSSGGIFSVLAEKCLDEGGVVVGVAQLGKAHFGHVIVDSRADLGKLRGSKYVQADAGLIYRDVRNVLKLGRKVLFSGTPCQVAALYAVLGKSVELADLITVDVVCHGSPSVKVFEKYISEISVKTSAQVQSTLFRDKNLGWRMYSMTSSLNTSSGDCFQYSKPHREDKFMRVFLQNICLNTSCADCHYGKLPRIADISLGDYWNIANVHPEVDDNKGTSVVLLNTERGKELFASVSEKVVQCESKVDYAIAGNACIVRSSKQHLKRLEFFENLDKNSLDKLIKKYCPYPSLAKSTFLRLRSKLKYLRSRFKQCKKM